MFMGYLNQPELTNNAFDQEGWFTTGDLARRDNDGFLYIIGRQSGMLMSLPGRIIDVELTTTLVYVFSLRKATIYSKRLIVSTKLISLRLANKTTCKLISMRQAIVYGFQVS